MCGFVGYLEGGRGIDIDLDRWGEMIHHRGPDQSGSMVRGSFGIATRRLSILDLSEAGSQPMESDRYVIGFNGEIYNHLDVRRDFPSPVRDSFRSTSDTETVVRAIEEWGLSGALSRLNGMYALAVWDKHSSELSLARDPLGVKPLFYSRQQNGTLLFSSEVRALRPFNAGNMSTDAIALFLYFGFLPAPYSFLNGIHKVRAGELLTITSNGARSERIYPRFWCDPTPLAGNISERVEQLRFEIDTAVTRQMLSDVPIGVFLSGGIDSTIIAHAASRGSQIQSFSLQPEQTMQDQGSTRDAEIARETAASLGIIHHDVRLSPEDILGDLDEYLVRLDEPVAELYSAAEILLSARARNESVKVVLTGHGADEIFLGYPTYMAANRRAAADNIPFLGPLLGAGSRLPILPAATRQNLYGVSRVWRQTPRRAYAVVSGVHNSPQSIAETTGLPLDRIEELIDGVIATTEAAAALLPVANELSPAEQHARRDLMLMVPDHYNTRLDRTSMASSVEARVPFQDLQLVGFVMQIAGSELMSGGLKGMLRRAYQDVLPDAIVHRTKQTFQAPMVSWTNGTLASWIDEQLIASPLACRRQETETNHSRAADAYRRWSLALLEGWRHAHALEY